MGQETQLRRLAGSRKAKNSPPIFSQEFIIQNHGDIFSCILVLIFAGFMFQPTAPIANVFMIPQYNITDEARVVPTVYLSGRKDVATVLFYTVAAIVVHAVLQEYVLDKLQRKLHLSKTKTSKFTESGHLAVFAAYSVGHAAYIIHQEGWVTEIGKLWTGYPETHRQMSLNMKVFFLIQLAYWLHQFPEFYLQKCKRDEVRSRAAYTILYLIYIGAGYALNFTRVSVCMLCAHYLAEAVLHACRMTHFAEKTALAAKGFHAWNLLFVATRVACITLAFLTFWYGLRINETQHIDIAEGNFNTGFLRLNSLVMVCALQAYLMWNFIVFHLRRVRERQQLAASQAAGAGAKQHKRHQRKMFREVRDLPEADQHERVLRSNTAAQKKSVKVQ